jgi:hypothetical protein
MRRQFPSHAGQFFMSTATMGVVLSALAMAAISPQRSVAEPPGITLTQAGTPIWRPVDFQLFTAPASPFPDAFLHTIDLLLPLEGPSADPYVPHQPPYDMELSTNAAAAGFVYQTVFDQSAITFDPNGVWLAMMLLPDPGIIGSSRDFESGPVISNSLFPLATHAEMWLDGAKVETLQDGSINVRAGDADFDGASHRALIQAVWWPWADDPNAGPLGHHELRWSLRDVQNNGWNIVAQFNVVPEPSSLFIASAGAIGFLACRRRKRPSCEAPPRIGRELNELAAFASHVLRKQLPWSSLVIYPSM